MSVSSATSMESVPSASDVQPIRIGLIGVGGIARHHLNQLTKIAGVEITALCDTVSSQIEKAKTQFPMIAEAFETPDYHALLARGDVDAVEIATPHTQHVQQALDAIAAKKHILLEKPMVCRVEDAHTVLKHLEGYAPVFGLAYQRHAQSEFLYMQQKISSGELGAVQFIQALQCQQWKKGCAGTWRHDPALSGGGQLNDSGSHLLDIIMWMSGLTVREVSAFIDNCGVPVDINSALSIRFTNGAQGNISIVGDALCWHEDITLWMEKGIFFYRNGSLSFCGEDGKTRKIEKEEMPEGRNIDQDFVRAIRGEGTVAAPPLCGLRTIELTEAAWKSGAQNGVPVQMN